MGEDSAEFWSRVPDQRRQQRLTVRGIALVRAQRRRLLAEAVDISAHGVCLTASCALQVGSIHRLDLEIRRPTKSAISVAARVCFCIKEKSGYRIGLSCSLGEFVYDTGS